MQRGWDYKDVLDAIVTTGAKPFHVQAMAEAIRDFGINRKAIEPVLQDYGADSPTYFKEDLLDLLLSYLHIVLDDHAISENEYRDFGLLKILFRVQESDFFHYCATQVEEVMTEHFTYIMSDGRISVEEAFMTADLQSMFGLTSEQYFQIKERFTAKHNTI